MRTSPQYRFLILSSMFLSLSDFGSFLRAEDTLSRSTAAPDSSSTGVETEVTGRIVSVSLFKNGLSIVRLEVPLSGQGVCRLNDLPAPVHGTFLIESNDVVEARLEHRTVPEELPAIPGTSLQEELVGRKVTVHRRTGDSPLAGIVLHAPQRSLRTDSAEADSSPFETNRGSSRFLLLKTDVGVTWVAQDDVAALEVTGDPVARTIQRKQPVLLLVSRDGSTQKTCHVSYLTHGISWAPDYHVNLLSPERLMIEQHAAVRNELANLNDVEMFVISGFPNVQFGHVLSPLAPAQTWQQFFQQIGTRPGEMTFSSAILMQNSASVADRDVSGVVASAPDPGDAVDLSYVSMGRRSLAQGDAFLTSIGRAETTYERIVEWSIPDSRDEWGNPISSRQVDPATGNTLPDDVWDAIRFRNPLPFPMTGAPVMITAQGRFQGQSQTLWTNKDDEVSIRVSKALSIRTIHAEYENQTDDPGLSERDLVTIGGRRFRKVTVNGELRIENYRSVDTKLVVSRKFSGDFVSADAAPKINLREEGVWTVNRRNELTWLISLRPQEERIIKYQYTILVSF